MPRSDFTHKDGFRHFTHDLLSALNGTLWSFSCAIKCPMIFLMTPLIVHCLGTSVYLISPLFLDTEVVSDFSLLNSTAVNACDLTLVFLLVSHSWFPSVILPKCFSLSKI